MDGVDVSRYQGAVNWAAVKRAGYGFVYVKASEGTNPSYPTTDAQFRGAREAGLVAGLYHFAQPSLSAEANAQAFARQVNRLGATVGCLPPCLDLEVGSGNLSTWAQTFVSVLRMHTKCQKVMVYSGSSFFNAQVTEKWMDPNVALWIAHYNRPPGQPGYLSPRVAIHQFSQSGTVPGISALCDLNRMIWPIEQVVVRRDEDVTPEELKQFAEAVWSRPVHSGPQDGPGTEPAGQALGYAEYRIVDQVVAKLKPVLDKILAELEKK